MFDNKVILQVFFCLRYGTLKVTIRTIGGPITKFILNFVYFHLLCRSAVKIKSKAHPLSPTYTAERQNPVENNIEKQ